MRTENLFIFFRDFGVTATLSGVSFLVLFDEVHDPLLGSQGAEGKRITATCKTSDITSARHNQTITINGITYTIVGIQPIEDGNLTQLILEE